MTRGPSSFGSGPRFVQTERTAVPPSGNGSAFCRGEEKMFDLFHVLLPPAPGEISDPDLVLSSGEREILQMMIDSFFSPTEREARSYREELRAADDFGRWAAGRESIEVLEGVCRTMDSFNYHDESWTEYEALTVEKISRKDYEAELEQMPAGGSHAPFAVFSEAAGLFRAWKAPGHQRGKLKGWGDVIWSDYVIAYMTDVRDLPGFYRIVHAKGSDRYC